MKKTILLTILFTLFTFPFVVSAGLGQDLAGKILLQVEERGEAWYIHPTEQKRYYLQDGDAAYTIMRFLSLGIADADLALIPSVEDTTEMNTSSSVCASNGLANRLKGSILLQVEQNGEAWYVDVEKCRRIYLRDGQAAYDVMRFLGLGITNVDLTKVTIAQDSALPEGVEAPEPIPGGYQQIEVSTSNGVFTVDMITLNLADANLEIITDVIDDIDCDTNCSVQSLEDFVEDHGGFAAIHGTYFCPESYASCAGQTNSFFFPVYDSDGQTLINEDQLAYPTTGPLWVFDANNELTVFESTQDFPGVGAFESERGTTIQAAIGNLPLLIREGKNIVGEATLDTKQRTTPSSRGGIAMKGDTVYLLIAQGATVVDLAAVMEALGVDEGMNLDGGGSSALYYEGSYKVGPGRDLPNAIIFR